MSIAGNEIQQASRVFKTAVGMETLSRFNVLRVELKSQLGSHQSVVAIKERSGGSRHNGKPMIPRGRGAEKDYLHHDTSVLLASTWPCGAAETPWGKDHVLALHLAQTLRAFACPAHFLFFLHSNIAAAA